MYILVSKGNLDCSKIGLPPGVWVRPTCFPMSTGNKVAGVIAAEVGAGKEDRRTGDEEEEEPGPAVTRDVETRKINVNLLADKHSWNKCLSVPKVTPVAAFTGWSPLGPPCLGNVWSK